MSILIVGGHPNDWGIIPSFLDENDPRSAREQIDSHYIGGWHKFEGFKFDRDNLTLKYPGDPAYEPISAMRFRDEMLLMYPSAWVCIVQLDDTWEVARLD